MTSKRKKCGSDCSNCPCGAQTKPVPAPPPPPPTKPIRGMYSTLLELIALVAAAAPEEVERAKKKYTRKKKGKQ